MPVFLKVAGKEIPTGEKMDNARDARASYPSQIYDVWEEKGKIFVSVKKVKRNKYLRTPSKNGFY